VARERLSPSLDALGEKRAADFVASYRQQHHLYGGLSQKLAALQRWPTCRRPRLGLDVWWAALPAGIQIVGPYVEDRTPLKFAWLLERDLGGFIPLPAL
jgi:hypothetical protein